MLAGHPGDSTYSASGLAKFASRKTKRVFGSRKGETDIPLSAPFRDLTKGVGLLMSWRRVQQLIQEELHQTPHDYFDSRRLEHACWLRMHEG